MSLGKGACLVCLSLITFSVASADPPFLSPLSRYLGWGWSDGYHACDCEQGYYSNCLPPTPQEAAPHGPISTRIIRPEQQIATATPPAWRTPSTYWMTEAVRPAPLSPQRNVVVAGSQRAASGTASLAKTVRLPLVSSPNDSSAIVTRLPPVE
jgi:hypothetical protein